MIQGYFGSEGELYFQIDLIAKNRDIIAVGSLLDTGFTDWLAINSQDAEGLGWSVLGRKEMFTARGDGEFLVYEGTVCLAEQEYIIPVVAGNEITEILLGLKWLESYKLIVDKKANLLVLEP